MPHRFKTATVIREPLRPANALRATFARGYRLADLRRDTMAGLVVGVVALPLSMALAIASGVPPQHGLYTAIIAGSLIAILGGSMTQVSGPTAAFVVILAPISHNFGVGGLLVATMLAGMILLLMSIARLGKLVEFIPYPVTTGFTAGIAVVIATIQMRDFFGLRVEHMPEHYIERVQALFQAAASVQYSDLGIGLLTLLLLIFLPKLSKRIPAPIVALPLAAALALLLTHGVPGFQVATINSRFSTIVDGVSIAGIPRSLPSWELPWHLAGADGKPFDITFELIRALTASAFAIAILGAIESLLSAVISDGMTGDRHDPDAELFAQGMGNLVAPFFGGFAATGAIARTATNIRSGARSPIAAIMHSLFILAAIVGLAPLLGYLPMSSLAALLLVVAWNMAELKHVLHTLRVAPRNDVLVLLLCFGLTVIFDMVVAVSVGVVLASLLFMGRMAELAGAQLVTEGHAVLRDPLPRGVLLYEIGGPLFFGAAQKAMSALRTIQDGVHVVILDLRGVPVMDATGLVNLESVLDRLHVARIFVVIAGVQAQPLHLMAKAGWKHRDWLVIYRDFEHAVTFARTLADSDVTHATPQV